MPNTLHHSKMLSRHASQWLPSEWPERGRGFTSLRSLGLRRLPGGVHPLEVCRLRLQFGAQVLEFGF
eukprot:5445391-Pyramimonas_sp.AAC.1